VTLGSRSGGNAVFRETIELARPDGRDHRGQRYGDLSRKAVAEQNEHGYDRRQNHRRRVGMRQAIEDLPQPKQRIAGACGDPEHVTEHGNADLASDSGEKPGQYRTRQEIGEESEPEGSSQQQQPGGQQRGHPDQRGIVRATRCGERGERTCEDRCGCRVSGHDQMAGSAE
jgi:hypothetical protein